MQVIQKSQDWTIVEDMLLREHLYTLAKSGGKSFCLQSCYCLINGGSSVQSGVGLQKAWLVAKSL